MPKYLLREGILDDFFSVFITVWKQGRTADFKRRMKDDPQLIRLMDNLDKSLTALKKHFNELDSNPRYQDALKNLKK